jgi:hypothetical protein
MIDHIQNVCQKDPRPGLIQKKYGTGQILAN